MTTLYKTQILVAATTEPVTLDEAKEQLRIDSAFTLDDSLLSAYISAARDRCENYCNRYFTTQQILTVFYSSFPNAGAAIELPYSDLTSVDQISYTDSDNQIVNIDGADYSEDLIKQVIYPTDSWPVDASSYRITMTTNAPVELSGVKQAILMMVADMYEHREENMSTQLYMNPAVQAMLYPYRNNLGIK